MKRRNNKLKLVRRRIRQLDNLSDVRGGGTRSCHSRNFASMSSRPTTACDTNGSIID